MKSILQTSKHCWVCGSPNVVEHHVFEGTSNRKKSEAYGMKVYLCGKHHNGSSEGVHFNKTLDTVLKQYAQIKFEEKWTREDFVRVFGRNYL